jgi:serine/threonine protein kinase
MSESNKRERFGRYLILDHLVDGGMAKICRARFLGEQADKVVAIKMVQPQFSKDEAFKTMFMDEIRVTFGLLHPNVIQTYDYGMNKGQLYVAMEYCDGRNLKEFLEKLKERKFVFPVEISTYIVSQACQGLYYAHTFRDKLTGQEANIIHRDISPHNIMLTYDGAVKIIDFGIAKSQTNSESTQAGTIKGKLSYLAPEYLEGLELDARYDQFAVGITLWEMLCSRKLFKENNDLAVLKKIQECKIPAPSSINPNVPKELDAIVLKALSKDRTQRYENLDQMNRALMKFLYAKYPDFNATDLSYFSQELFRDEIKKDREKMFEFGKIDIKPFLEELKKETEGGSNPGAAAAAAAAAGSVDNTPVPKKEVMLDFGFEEAAKKKTSTVRRAAALKDTTNAGPDNALSQKVADLNTTSVTKIKQGGSTKSSVKKEGTKILKHEKKKQKSSLGTYAAMLALVAGGGFYFYSKFLVKPKAPVVTEVPRAVKSREPAQQKSDEEVTGMGKVVFSHFEKQKMQIFIDGERKDPDLMNSVQIPIGKLMTLRVQMEGKKHFVKEFQVDNEAALEIEIPEMPNIAYGYLFTSGACASGEIKFEVYGEKRTSPIPMVQSYGIAFPLNLDDNGILTPAHYEIFFKKQGEEIERKIDIELKREDQSIDLCDFL